MLEDENGTLIGQEYCAYENQGTGDDSREFEFVVIPYHTSDDGLTTGYYRALSSQVSGNSLEVLLNQLQSGTQTPFTYFDCEESEECNNIAELNLVIANAGIGVVNETNQAIYDTFNTNVFGVLNTVLPTIDIYKNNIINKKKDTSSLDRFITNMKNKKQAFYVPFWDKIRLSKNGNEYFHLHNHSIAIVSSIAGYHGLSTCPAYSATKACVKAWGEALRIKLRKDGINVSVICPGFVRSRITDKNTCPMPYFMEGDVAAKIIAKGLEKNKGIIAFPWQLRFATWLVSILPNWLSDKIYAKLPNKA